MEISPMRGYPEMGFDNMSFINQWQMNSFDELSILPTAAAFGGHTHSSLSQPSINFKASVDDSYNRPSKLHKPNYWTSCKTEQLSTPQAVDPANIVSFINSNFTNANSNYTLNSGVLKPKEEEAVCSDIIYKASPDLLSSQVSSENQNFVFKACQGGKRVTVTDNNRSSHTQDHIMAERKRREKLSQRFIALSALVPGLKKMDKVSVLGDATKYLKQLQEKVKTLEEQTRKRSTESVVLVKKSQVFDDGISSTNEDSLSDVLLDEPLPEIEARVSERDVLIKIHCEKRRGAVEKIIAEVEKLQLTIINSNSVTFGTFALDVTIIAQMNPEFCLSLKELVKTLQSALKPLTV